MSDRSSPSLSQFLERWHRFSVAVKELHPYVDVIRQVEGILEEDDSSKAELEQSKKQIADLEYAKREMKGIFAQRILAQQKEHDSDLSKIKAQAKKAEERANLHCARLRESDQQLLGLKEELDSQCEKLSAKIHEHDHIYFVLGIVGLDDSFSARLDQLAKRIHTFAGRTFLDDAENLGLREDKDKTFRYLIDSEFIDCARPIPISTSKISRYLRMATMEALIAKEISTNVFRATPMYTSWLKSIAPNPDWDTLAKAQPLQEAVLRSVSAIVYSREKHDLEENEIAKITDAICRKSRPLIMDMISFEDELQILLRDACDTWKATQRSPRRVIALTDGRGCLEIPAYDFDEGISITRDVNGERPGGQMMTFPTILFVDTGEVIHPGYMLRACNPLFTSGAIEVQSQAQQVTRRVSAA